MYMYMYMYTYMYMYEYLLCSIPVPVKQLGTSAILMHQIGLNARQRHEERA